LGVFLEYFETNHFLKKRFKNMLYYIIGWKHIRLVGHFGVHNSTLIVFKIFNCSYFQFICVNDGMKLKSIMNSYIKTHCKIFMTKSLVSKLLWTFKVVQKLYLIWKEMNIYSIHIHIMSLNE
jgi:hypothetical protein